MCLQLSDGSGFPTISFGTGTTYKRQVDPVIEGGILKWFSMRRTRSLPLFLNRRPFCLGCWLPEFWHCLVLPDWACSGTSSASSHEGKRSPKGRNFCDDKNSSAYHPLRWGTVAIIKYFFLVTYTAVKEGFETWEGEYWNSSMTSGRIHDWPESWETSVGLCGPSDDAWTWAMAWGTIHKTSL